MSVYDINGNAIVEKGFYPSVSLFDTMGIVGDSYASGEIYTNSLTDYYNVSWGQIFGRLFGITVTNYSKGGLSCKTWLENTKYGASKLSLDKPMDIYLVSLGLNDANILGISKLGSISDIESDSTDSFYSYYGRVMRLIMAHAPEAIVVLSTLARWNTTYNAFSDAIKEIGSYYNLPVLDLSKSAFFKSSFFSDNMLSNHPIAINYSAMAKEYGNLIEEALEKNVQEFVGFVGDPDKYHNVQNYCTPENYGAVGDGIVDDTLAVQNAINNRGLILFASDKQYKITTTIRIGANTILDLNGSSILSANKHLFFNFQSEDTFTGYNGNGNIVIRNGTIIGGALSFAHGENILLENIIFKNSLNDHFLEIAGCKNYVIENCRFIGMANVSTSVQEYINIDPCTHAAFPWLTDGSAFYDGTKNDGIKVNNCYFSLGEGDYAYGYNAFGVHGVAGQSVKHKNIRLTNNEVLSFTGCGFRINDMENVFIANNEINVEGDGIRVGDVGQSTNAIIKGNIIIASGTAVTKDNNSTVFQSADNDINPTFS